MRVAIGVVEFLVICIKRGIDHEEDNLGLACNLDVTRSYRRRIRGVRNRR